MVAFSKANGQVKFFNTNELRRLIALLNYCYYGGAYAPSHFLKGPLTPMQRLWVVKFRQVDIIFIGSI